jgi:hypothetical protein
LKKVKNGKNINDQHLVNRKKTVRPAADISFVATAKEEDHRQSSAWGTFVFYIHTILHQNLGLRFARWVLDFHNYTRLKQSGRKNCFKKQFYAVSGKK